MQTPDLPVPTDNNTKLLLNLIREIIDIREGRRNTATRPYRFVEYEEYETAITALTALIAALDTRVYDLENP